MSKFLCKKTRVLVPCQIFGCILMLSLFLSVANSYDTYAYSATMTINGSVSTTVNPTENVNTTITTDEIGVTTNCRAGYNLTISGPSDRNLYLNGNSSINASGSYFTPVDGTSTLANQTNAWGYSLTANTDSGIFTPLPSGTTTIRNTSQTASETDIEDTVPIYYGVSTSNVINPGLYKMSNNSTIIYQLTMDDSCISFTVNYNANGGTGTMTDQDITIGASTKLSSNEFTAPAFGESYQDADGNTITATPNKLWTFWGWNTEVDGTGDWYKDREQVTNLAGNNETITLYAQWKQATLADLTTSPSGANKTIDHNTMQDMSAEACWNSDKFTAIGTPYGQATLTDSRDGTTRTYTIAKLPDSLCWMTQNLNLGASTDITLTPDDTDITSDFVLPASTTDFATSNSTENYVLPKVLTDDTYGGYYSYAAAIANTSSYSSTINIATSICPRNWDLPTRTQYNNLRTVTGNTTFAAVNASPYNFIYAGYRNGTSFSNQTNTIRLWTSTNYSSSQAYYTTAYNTANYNYKRYGESIRCVASPGDATINYYANNGSGSTLTQNVRLEIDEKLKTASTFEAASHKQFKEWNTSQDGTGTSYNANDSVTIMNLIPGQSIDLYAIWDDTWTITFVNTYNNASQTKNVIQGQSTTVSPSTNWTRTNYKLKGWDTNSAGSNVVYNKGQSITPNNDITLYTVWTPTYTINYNGNSASAGAMGQTHTNVGGGDEISLFAPNYKRNGYGFAGWSFDNSAQPGGTATIYGPNEVIAAPNTSNPGETKTLYAVWVASAGNIQNWNGCSSMNTGEVTALTDLRDNNVYTVSRLADGNCWMTENLRLDSEYSVGNNQNNSSITNESLSQGYARSTIYGNFVGLASSESQYTYYTTHFNSLYYTDARSGSATININNMNDSSHRLPHYNNLNVSQHTSSTPTSGNANIYSYGNYYSWHAAIADTSYYQTEASPSTTSLCPTGWRLPRGGSKSNETSNDYWNLVVNGINNGVLPSNYDSTIVPTYGSNDPISTIRSVRQYPNNFVLSGSFSGSSSGPSSRGSIGEYWSSTARTLVTSSWQYDLSDSYVRPGDVSSEKYFAMSIRCIKNPNELEVTLIDNSSGQDEVVGRAYAEAGAQTLLPTPTRSGYDFTSWNTSSDGNGTDYIGSYTFSPSATNNVTLYTQWVDCSPGEICYDGNGGNDIEGTMRSQIVDSSATSIVLFASNYSRTGYGFAGWNTSADGTGIYYGPNETIEDPTILNTIQSNGLKLYAIWIASAGNIQNWSGCSNMSIGEVTALTDIRDNETYAIAKLVDGKCWMIENLRLSNNQSTPNWGNNNLSQGFGGAFVGLAESETSNYNNSTTANSLYNTGNITGSNQGYRFPRYNNGNTYSRKNSPDSGDAKIFSYGNYYSWSSAVANTNDLSINNQSFETTSICPAGWRLPKGGDKDNENDNDLWYYLVEGINNGTKPANYNDSMQPYYDSNEGIAISKLVRKYPNNFVYSGDTINGITVNRSYSSLYWTSTSNSASQAYGLYIQNSVRPNYADTKSYGFTIRCVNNN